MSLINSSPASGGFCHLLIFLQTVLIQIRNRQKVDHDLAILFFYGVYFKVSSSSNCSFGAWYSGIVVFVTLFVCRYLLFM